MRIAFTLEKTSDIPIDKLDFRAELLKVFKPIDFDDEFGPGINVFYFGFIIVNDQFKGTSKEFVYLKKNKDFCVGLQLDFHEFMSSSTKRDRLKMACDLILSSKSKFFEKKIKNFDTERLFVRIKEIMLDNDLIQE